VSVDDSLVNPEHAAMLVMYLLLAVAANYAAVFTWGMINRSWGTVSAHT
jgi:hypothetical protein